MEITTTRKGKTIGVNRNGKAIGYATRIKRNRWTTLAYTTAAPFDRHVGVFNDEAAAIEAIATVGETPVHLL